MAIAIKRSLTDNVNLWTQILSSAFYALFLAGLDINPDQTATEIVSALKSQSLFLIIGAAVNFGTMIFLWIKTWKDKKPNFWAFITSRSWIISLANILIPLLATWGIYIGNETVEKLVDYALSGDWKNFGILLLITVIGAIGTLFKSKMKATTVNIPAQEQHKARA